MNRNKYQLRQILIKMSYRKKEYVMYVVSFYLGLLLPAFCIANIRSTDQVIYFSTFENMEDSIQIDWFSNSFLDIKTEDANSVSLSGYYEEDFADWGHQYVQIRGIDEYYMYALPEVTGRTFTNSELREGKKVCLMNQKYADKYSYKEGDKLSIHNVDFEIIGFTQNKIHTAILIPYAAMEEVYQSGKGIQFTAMVLVERTEDKDRIVESILNEITNQSDDTEILQVVDGEELYRLSQETKLKWRLLRGIVAMVSIVFFLLNEGIILIEKIKKEQRTIGVYMAAGATKKDVCRSYLLEILIITSIAAGLVLITISPWAILFGIEDIIIVDGVVIAEFLFVAVIACELLGYATIRRTKMKQISALLKTRNE